MSVVYLELCTQRGDVNAFHDLQERFPDRVLATRYEDIAEKPMENSKKLYEFLNLTFTNEIAQHVHNNTQSGQGNKGTYSLARKNSTEASYEWRKSIQYDDVINFDRQCREIYFKLGYIPANTEKELRNLDRPLKFDKQIYS